MKAKPEAQLENMLLGDNVTWPSGLSWMHLGRQLPVGLFDRVVSKKTAIFPGGSSAIDLWGVDAKKRAWIFELKAKGNTTLGIISELLLYANLIREAISPQIPHLNFSPEVPQEYSLLSQCTGVVACFLTEGPSHPLLTTKVLALLNTGRIEKGIPLCFCSAQINPEQKVVMTDCNAL